VACIIATQWQRRRNQPTLWLCTKCWRILPRADAEKLSLAQGAPTGAADWKCPSCGAIGQFASDSSPEFAEFANDLVFSALAASMQEAGYDVLAYSAQCDKGDHEQCPGTNRAGEPLFERCRCECHTSAYLAHELEVSIAEHLPALARFRNILARNREEARYAYVLHYYHHLMTRPQRLAYETLMLTAKRMDDRTDVHGQIEARNIPQHPATSEAFTLSDDPEVLRLVSEGLWVFVTRTAQRILAEHSEQVQFNNCPQCGAVARTPKARQCRFCGFDWHTA